MTDHKIAIAYPPGFAPIPLDATPDERVRKAEALLAAVSDGQISDRDAAIDALAILGGELAARGVRAAGQFTLLDQPPTVTAMMMLSVNALPDGGMDLTAHGTREAATEAIAAVLRDHSPQSVVETTNLSSGAAVIVHRAGQFEFPGSVTKTGQEVDIPSRGVQYMLPTPNGKTMLTLDVSSPHLEHWERFADMARAMADSITFTPVGDFAR